MSGEANVLQPSQSSVAAHHSSKSQPVSAPPVKSSGWQLEEGSAAALVASRLQFCGFGL